MVDELIISPDDDSDISINKVVLGTHVDLRLVYEGLIESFSFDLVLDHLADFDNGFLSIEAPLVKAILNHKVGETIPYLMGDIRAVYIENITPVKSLPSPENALKRLEIIPKALADSERTNAVIFASSFSGKWGDYDPGNIKEDW